MIKKILIVDDEESIRSGLSRVIGKYYGLRGEIDMVENGRQALEAFGTCYYDICFLDINLPDISGIEIMEELNYTQPGTRVVIMTAGEVTPEMMEKIEEGADLFITKPIDLDFVRSFIYNELEIGRDPVSGEHKPERRHMKRIPEMMIVHYSVSVFYNWELKSDLEADIIDINEYGAGIRTCYPLYPGNVLRFNKLLNSMSGIVKWCVKDNKNFRAGIRFL